MGEPICTIAHLITQTQMTGQAIDRVKPIEVREAFAQQ